MQYGQLWLCARCGDVPFGAFLRRVCGAIVGLDRKIGFYIYRLVGIAGALWNFGGLLVVFGRISAVDLCRSIEHQTASALTAAAEPFSGVNWPQKVVLKSGVCERLHIQKWRGWRWWRGR